jgi:hypothetical protein
MHPLFEDNREAIARHRSVYLVELRAIRNRRLRHYIEQSRSPIYSAA